MSRQPKILLLTLLAAAALLLAACGSSDNTTQAAATPTPSAKTTLSANVRTATNPTFGEILTDAQGKTLYTFTKDGADVACTGACAAVWPPLAGTRYFRFVNDTAPGDANGEGIDSFGGIWHVARPAGATASTATTVAPSSATNGGYDY